jgi:hypothetical protein
VSISEEKFELIENFLIMMVSMLEVGVAIKAIFIDGSVQSIVLLQEEQKMKTILISRQNFILD